MNTMSGKKVVKIFLVVTAISGIAAFLVIKKGYDTRPHVQIEEEKKN